MSRRDAILLVVLIGGLGFIAGWFLVPRSAETPESKPAPKSVDTLPKRPPTPLTKSDSLASPETSPEPGPTAPDIRPNELAEKTRWRVELGPSSPSLGSTEALVTIVVFGDVSSRHTAKAMGFVARAVDESPADVRLVWKHMPTSGQTAARRGELALAAAHTQKAFWRMQPALFERRNELASVDYSAIARELELDVQKFEKTLPSPQLAAAVDADLAQAKTLGLKAAPTIFVNGRKLAGLRSYEPLSRLVDEEKKHALSLMKRGISRPAMYWQIMAGAKRP